MSLVLHTPFDLQHLIAIIVDPIKANDILDRRQTITREYSSFLFSVMALVYLLDKDGTYIHCHASCGRQLGLGGYVNTPCSTFLTLTQYIFSLFHSLVYSIQRILVSVAVGWGWESPYVKEGLLSYALGAHLSCLLCEIVSAPHLRVAAWALLKHCSTSSSRVMPISHGFRCGVGCPGRSYPCGTILHSPLKMENHKHMLN